MEAGHPSHCIYRNHFHSQSPANDERPPGHPRMAFGIQFGLIFTPNYAEEIMETHICFSFAFHFHFVWIFFGEYGSGRHIMRRR